MVKYAVTAILVMLIMLMPSARAGEDSAMSQIQLLLQNTVLDNQCIWPVQLPGHSKSILSVTESDGDIIIFCKEGKHSLLPRETDGDSPMSVNIVRKQDMKLKAMMPVNFINLLERMEEYGTHQSFTALSQHNEAFFIPNIGNIYRSNSLIIHVNSIGSICRPGQTITQAIFTGLTSADFKQDILSIRDYIDGNIEKTVRIPALHGYRLVQYINNRYGVFAQTGLEGNTTTVDHGCQYNKIVVDNLHTSTTWSPEPMIPSKDVTYSDIAILEDEYFWWEYYPGTRQSNGIWILRRKKNDGACTIVLAAKRIEGNFYKLTDKEWVKCNAVDPSIPIVKLCASDNLLAINVFGDISIRTIGNKH